MNATERISSLFVELLQWQFPLDDTHQIVALHLASDFADQLNRAIKETTQKITSQLIAERVFQEAKFSSNTVRDPYLKLPLP